MSSLSKKREDRLINAASMGMTPPKPVMHHRTPLSPISRSIDPYVYRKLWTTSCPDILHERGNLNELDARTHAVKTGYSLK